MEEKLWLREISRALDTWLFGERHLGLS
jgi:hypothetical protein